MQGWLHRLDKTGIWPFKNSTTQLWVVADSRTLMFYKHEGESGLLDCKRLAQAKAVVPQVTPKMDVRANDDTAYYFGIEWHAQEKSKTVMEVYYTFDKAESQKWARFLDRMLQTDATWASAMSHVTQQADTVCEALAVALSSPEINFVQMQQVAALARECWQASMAMKRSWHQFCGITEDWNDADSITNSQPRSPERPLSKR
mmetsp:Transcript_124218/g.215308  ORF Transcript_124218/g.215308 Transcript_124218/m.215308 type:complete len:202 (-) Transcript_124218:533-1138(-)